MKTFIAYFDYLGYKEFLLRNTEKRLKIRAGHILRDIETALSQDKFKQVNPAMVIPDLSECNVNCLNISDTIIFWTKDDSMESCEELIKVCHHFNWRQNLYNFPVRGCLIYDNFEFMTGRQTNPNGAVYSPNLMYGKGLLHAHSKSDSLNWAGTVLDTTLIEKISESTIPPFIYEYAIKYKVPYKGFYRKEYALKLTQNISNQTQIDGFIDDIYRVFEMDNKSITSSVEEKMKNTIDFIKFNYELDKKSKENKNK